MGPPAAAASSSTDVSCGLRPAPPSADEVPVAFGAPIKEEVHFEPADDIVDVPDWDDPFAVDPNAGDRQDSPPTIEIDMTPPYEL